MKEEKTDTKSDKKTYQKPKLTVFGKLNEITQGSTPGSLESGGTCGLSTCRDPNQE